jgi:hemerythrin
MTIKWQPEYTIWDAELDEHHQQLIRYIQVLDDPENRRRADPNFLQMVLDGLVSYAAFHFEAEERKMRASGYPGLAAHQVEHVEFAKDVVVFHASFGRVSPRFERVVVNYLKDWLTTHILSSDKQFGEWMKSQGSATD